MPSLKPFVGVTFFSMILALLLILLGVKYHWGDYFQPRNNRSSIELSLPEAPFVDLDENIVTKDKTLFIPEIVQNKNSNTLLASMNKEQMEEQCINLLSKNIRELSMLELAAANCVVSNYQEDFEDIDSLVEDKDLSRKKLAATKQCVDQHQFTSFYSEIETQLLIGICVSDKLTF